MAWEEVEQVAVDREDWRGRVAQRVFARAELGVRSILIIIIIINEFRLRDVKSRNYKVTLQRRESHVECLGICIHIRVTGM